jgi:anhydro-N-acetylmuramic acid kinase
MAGTDHFYVIGLMSGTSLDGVDLAYCSFTRKNKKWNFSIHSAETVAYDKTWRTMLQAAHLLPGEDLLKLNVLYGSYLGTLCNAFCAKHAIRNIDFIASHGHTVFHQPELGFTFQLGDGNTLHATTGKKVVCDFRSLDVARGGQGAPLVPVGDYFLFGDYDVCLNLGGIANCSMLRSGKRIAFDVCFVNMALNYLAMHAGKHYDKNGAMASAGNVDKHLLRGLTSVYSKIRNARPSLGREFFDKEVRPLLDRSAAPVADKLATVVESAAYEISRGISNGKNKTVLCTGGGAYNAWLMYRLLELGGDNVNLVIPNELLVKFKEAVVFGFLGVLRVRNEINCLKSVTGARQDSSSGVLIGF